MSCHNIQTMTYIKGVFHGILNLNKESSQTTDLYEDPGDELEI